MSDQGTAGHGRVDQVKATLAALRQWCKKNDPERSDSDRSSTSARRRGNELVKELLTLVDGPILRTTLPPRLIYIIKVQVATQCRREGGIERERAMELMSFAERLVRAVLKDEK